MNSYSRDLFKENNQLHITQDLKIQVDLLENRKKNMAKCLLCKCRVPTSTDMGEEGMTGWGLLLPSFSLGPRQLQCSRRSSGAGDGVEESLVPAGGRGWNQQQHCGVISQCLFQCLLGCRRGGAFAGCLSICGIQSCAGHPGTAHDSNTAVVRTHCLSLPFPP